MEVFPGRGVLSVNGMTGVVVITPAIIGAGTVQGTDGNLFNIRVALEGAVVGNARGENSVDLQTNRVAADRVASGVNSFLVAGEACQADGLRSGVLAGIYNRVFSTYGLILNGYSNDVLAGATYGTIINGNRNEVTTTNGFICSGTLCESDNGFIGMAYGNFARAGGAAVAGTYNEANGNRNFVGAGSYNVSVSSDTCIVAGFGNEFTHDSCHYSGIVCGYENEIGNILGNVGAYAFLGGGQNNLITEHYAAILGGRDAWAYRYGEQSFSAGMFTTRGDAQRSELCARASVTHDDATWRDLYLDGSSEGFSPCYSPGMTTLFILLSGATAGAAKIFFFIIKLAVKRVSEHSIVIRGLDVDTIDVSDDVSFEAQVVADGPNRFILIQVRDTDGAGDTVYWHANIKGSELHYPS